jgi:hypothetical protein
MIETKADFAHALERLRGREPEALTAFILSLAQQSGVRRWRLSWYQNEHIPLKRDLE